MQLQDLEIFIRLYQLRSLNQAAKSLGFAQSNMTVRLKHIESEFGVRLFTRDHRGLTPTQNGMVVRSYVRQGLSQV